MPFPITPTEIAKTEARSGIVFPAAFKDRMAADNGGNISVAGDAWTLHPFLDESDRKRIARTCGDIIHETMQMREWRGFPQDGFAIANNGCGDCLYLLPITEGSRSLGETIFRFDHETGESEPAATSIAECR